MKHVFKLIAACALLMGSIGLFFAGFGLVLMVKNGWYFGVSAAGGIVLVASSDFIIETFREDIRRNRYERRR